MDEGVEVEAFYVCDFRRTFVSPSQPCRGVHQDSQICDDNHIFVTSLARFFYDKFSEFFVFATRDVKFDASGEPSIIWYQICHTLTNLLY